MKHWIPAHTQLSGSIVALVPMQINHFSALKSIAADPKIWAHYAYNGSDAATFQRIFIQALAAQKEGTQFPFVIYHLAENKIIGSTRLIDIQAAHKKVEIGATWLEPAYWGTSINLECKLLLLTYCFETLHTIRVQLKTDELNIRSRKAIEKIGAQLEGVLRKDILRDNNTNRSTAYYSIIDEEWQKTKLHLLELLGQHNENASSL